MEHQLERLEVLLPLEMAKLLRTAVESGEYASAGEVVRDALRMWRRQRDLEARKLAALRRGEREDAEDAARRK